MGSEQEGRRKRREGTGRRKETRKGVEGGEAAGGEGPVGTEGYTGTDKWRKKTYIPEPHEAAGMLQQAARWVS